MVGSSYLVRKPARPSAAKVAFDQQVMPFAINTAGAAEGALERVAAYTRQEPNSALLSAALLGLALGLLASRRR